MPLGGLTLWVLAGISEVTVDGSSDRRRHGAPHPRRDHRSGRYAQAAIRSGDRQINSGTRVAPARAIHSTPRAWLFLNSIGNLERDMRQKRVLSHGAAAMRHVAVEATAPRLRHRPLLPWLLCTMAMLAIAPEARAQMTYAPCLNLPSPLPNRGGTIFLSNIGANGSDGASAGFDKSGNAGQPGNPGSALVLNLPSSFLLPIGINSISLFSLGGNGGEGSDASAGNAGGAISGGKGSLGGAGGAVAIGTAAPVTLPGSSLLNSAVCAYSAGGNGGQAGRSGVLGTKSHSGSYPHAVK